MKALYFGLFFLFCTATLGQSTQTEIPPGVSEKDFNQIQRLKYGMARNINPNPDSALYFILKLQRLCDSIDFKIGSFEADHLMAQYYRRLQKLDSAIHHFQTSLRLAEDMSYSKGISVSYNGLCRIYYIGGQLEKAKQACEHCLEELRKNPNHMVLADTYIAYGNLFIRENKRKEALSQFLKVDSLHTNSPLRADIIAAAFQSIGGIYQELEDYEKAENYFLLANQEFEKIPRGAEFYLNTTKWHLGEVYFEKGEMAKADSLLKLSFPFFKNIQDKGALAQINLYLGLIALEKGQEKEAENFLQEAFALHKEIENAYESSLAALELGNLYLIQNKTEKARYYLEEARALGSNSFIEQQVLMGYAKSYELESKFSEAYKFLVQSQDLKDSLDEVQSSAQILEIEERYQNEKKEQEIELLKTQKQLVESSRTNQRNLFIAGMASLLLLIGALFVLNRNRQKTYEKLRELDHMKSNFFANISHEFRTPLSLISAPIQKRLDNPELSSSDKADFELVQRNSKRLLELVDQVLDLSKLEAGSWQLQLKEAPLMSFISAITSSFNFLAEEKQIHYQRELEESNLIYSFDPDALEKILSNLLFNALKYTPSEGKIFLRAKQLEEGLELQISNSSKKLSETELDRMFKRFEQLDGQQTGSGLGLSLVKELVELHQGKLEVRQEEDNMLHFHIFLALQKQDFKQEIIPPDSKENKITESSSATEIEKPVLLIVEDHPDLRKLIQSEFEEKYQVLLAKDGLQGWDLAISHIPDLIISDIMMPGKNGIELCEEIKRDERSCHIPLILLTAKAGEENELLGIETGADDYISKPFNSKLLKAKVAQLINQRKQLQKRYSRQIILKPKDIAIRSLDEQFLERVQKVLDDQLIESDFTVEAFSQAVGMSRMQLHRKLKALTGLSASNFIRSERLKIAAKLLKESDNPVSEIAYRVGFNDPSYFSKSFREQYGSSPKSFAEKNR